MVLEFRIQGLSTGVCELSQKQDVYCYDLVPGSASKEMRVA